MIEKQSQGSMQTGDANGQQYAWTKGGRGSLAEQLGNAVYTIGMDDGIIKVKGMYVQEENECIS